MGVVFDTLEKIGMTSEESKEVISKKTRNIMRNHLTSDNFVIYKC